MSKTIDQIKAQLLDVKARFEDKASKVISQHDLDTLKSTYLGKKSPITEILKQVSDLPKELKPTVGKLANETKQNVLELIEKTKASLEERDINKALASNTIDPTLPPVHIKRGHKHPVTQTIEEITNIFKKLGYTIKTGPEIEDNHHNFEALNIPEDHPARDMHDTFYLSQSMLLRTHTSPVQIRTMESEKPPIKIIIPGKVYRCDADVTHSPVFHQIEGLYINRNVTFAELKATLEYFLKALFGQKQGVRFRPSYFPFTEPSTEVDVECFNCKGKGCSLCKQTGWIEILGAGMVHPNVLKATNLNPEEVKGFAFGLGIDRIAMLKYKISDIRLLYENDTRFLEQF